MASASPPLASAPSAAAPSTASLRLRAPRSLPPWIDSYQARFGPPSEDQLRLLSPPLRTLGPRRAVADPTSSSALADPASSSAPADAATLDPLRRRVSRDGFIAVDDPQLGPPAPDAPAGLLPRLVPRRLVRRGGRRFGRGRRWDHLRSADPVIVPGFAASAAADPPRAWSAFLHSSAWGRAPGERAAILSYRDMCSLQPSFSRGPDAALDARAAAAAAPTAALSRRAWRRLVGHSLSPLLFRLAVALTSLLALGIAARIFLLEDASNRNTAERTQSIVAIVVDCVAIPYIGYMLWDEYTGKPVGLRSGVSKIRLILLDLVFIIFKSASTALAFESLVYHKVRDADLVRLSAALGAFELLGLVSWTMTFTVNVFRTVERLGGGASPDFHAAHA